MCVCVHACIQCVFNVSLQCLFVFLFNALLRFNSMRFMYESHVFKAHVTVMEMMLMY